MIWRISAILYLIYCKRVGKRLVARGVLTGGVECGRWVPMVVGEW